jgi:RHS repeat-associated protein
VGALGRVARYDHDPSRVDQLLAQIAGQKVYAFKDALGSVYGITDATTTATVRARYAYDAFGTRTASTEILPTAWAYSGRREDPSGLIYLRSRYYESRNGNFTAVDPKQYLAKNYHAYLYVQNNPTLMTDPAGELFPGGTTKFTWNDPEYDIDFEQPPPEHLGRIKQASDLVTVAIVTNRRCQRAFSEARSGQGCPLDTTGWYFSTNAEVYRWTNVPRLTQAGNAPASIFAWGRWPPAIGYADLTWRIGYWALAATFTHELAHYAAGRGHGQPVSPDDVTEACGFHRHVKLSPAPHFID